MEILTGLAQLVQMMILTSLIKAILEAWIGTVEFWIGQVPLNLEILNLILEILEDLNSILEELETQTFSQEVPLLIQALILEM